VTAPSVLLFIFLLSGIAQGTPCLELYPAPNTPEVCPKLELKFEDAPLLDPHFEKNRWPCIVKGGLWAKRQAQSTLPDHAKVLIPELKRWFVIEGLPQELAWVAEVESMLNTNAVSGSGARGLFQFKREAARRFGLLKEADDFRAEPEKSAKAAARYLAKLYAQFSDWTLAVAAYNAGEGCVGRLLKKHETSEYEAIAPYLPPQTQVYVIKVMTTLALRENTQLSALPSPTIPTINPIGN